MNDQKRMGSQSIGFGFLMMMLAVATTTSTVQAVVDLGDVDDNDDDMVNVMIGFQSLADKVAFIENQMLPNGNEGSNLRGAFDGTTYRRRSSKIGFLLTAVLAFC